MARVEASDEVISSTMTSIFGATQNQIARKGRLTFTSTHECLGVLEEEMHELREAVRLNRNGSVQKELHDIAVAALWSLVSIHHGAMDW